MPLINNGGVNIYYEVHGKGTPIVLLHGLAESFLDWFDVGYVNALQKYYQLILIDMRGHGKSDKPHDPNSYDYKTRASDIVAVLDDLQIEKAVFFGFSQGGWVGYPLAGIYGDRLLAFILIGAQPQIFQRKQLHLSAQEAKELIHAYTQDAMSKSREFLNEKQIERWLNCDFDAISAALDGDKPSFMEYLSHIKIEDMLFPVEIFGAAQ